MESLGSRTIRSIVRGLALRNQEGSFCPRPKVAPAKWRTVISYRFVKMACGWWGVVGEGGAARGRPQPPRRSVQARLHLPATQPRHTSDIASDAYVMTPPCTNPTRWRSNAIPINQICAMQGGCVACFTLPRYTQAPPDRSTTTYLARTLASITFVLLPLFPLTIYLYMVKIQVFQVYDTRFETFTILGLKL